MFSESPSFEGLNARQVAFAKVFAETNDRALAHLEAGYRSPQHYQCGSDLLQNHKIYRYVQVLRMANNYYENRVIAKIGEERYRKLEAWHNARQEAQNKQQTAISG